ncbi:MAG: LamG-like jellyroll fold domain-containing protein [Candidatus Woesearchaeota archaeon]
MCWGWNSNGGLGDGTTDNRLVPTLTSDSSGFVSVSAGTYHSCGVRANDSRVLCWGYNGNGQLGDGTTDQRENPTLTSDSSSYYHGFSSSTEYNISVLQSGFTSLNDEWTLSCRAVFGEEYTAWEESDVTTIVPPSECGVISSPGSHVLNRDLNSTGTCITINVSDVSINCLGHTINYSTNDEEGYGILIWSQSDTVENVSIANCNIIKESPGGSSGSRRPAILGYGYSDTPSGGFTKSGDEHTVEHVSISNVTITTEGDHARGIFVLSGHTWSVEDVSITTYGDDARGVYSETSDYWNLSSVDITTFGTVGIGLYVIDANHYYLKDIDITAASAGMWIRTGSSNWRAENISINATLQGIATSDGGMAHMSFYNSTIHSSGSRGLDTNQGTDNISFYDSTITAPSSDDVYMRLGDASRRVSFVNVTFNPSSVTFHDSSSGFLDVGWWVDAYIDDPDDDPIEGVNISWADSGSVSGNPTALGWMLTDSHGSARTYVFEHTRSHTGTYSYNDYTFNITSTLLDVAFLDESYEITDNIELYYTLGNATLSIWDGTKPQGGSNLYSIGLDVPFYAEYLRLNDSTPITTASCTIAFDSGSGYGVGQSMTYNASSEYYEYGSDFPSGGFYDYQVTCTSDYTGRTQTSTFGYGDFSVVDVELVHEEDYEVSYAVIGTPAYNTTDWRSEGVSLAVVNMPFTVNESSSDTGAIADLSTYHNNGTLINAPTWEDDCVIGGCYRFDPDSEQYIEIADSVSLNFTDDLSFSVWVYRDGWSENWANIFSKGNDAYLFRRSYNTDRLYLTVWNATGGYFDLETTTNIDTGTWYHIAGVYSVTEDRAELYVNGFLEDSDPPIGPIRQVSDPMGLGARYRIGSGADRYWDGLIDGFVLYDRALSQEQIQAIHAAESQGRSVNTFDGPYDGSAVSVRVYSSETTEYVYADSNELRRFDQCGVIDESGSYALVDDVSASGTCFTINTSDVSLDCSGYTINYSQSSVGYGILVTGGNSNINISNCGIFQGGTSSDSRGILLNGSASNTINNIVIDNIEGDGRGLSNINILTNATNNINVSNINLTNSGEGGVIILFTNNTNISLKDSYGNCTGADCVVFYMRASSNSLSTNLSAFSSASDSYLFLFLGGTNNTLDGFIGNNTGAVTYGSGSLAVLQSYTNATINNATVISTSIDSFAINSMVHTVNVTNSYFSTSSGNDIGVWWGTNKPVIYLINTTYEDININSDSEAILHRGWYIDFFVNDTSGNPVNNVNVSWNDAGTISGTPSSIGWNITDGSGLSARNILYQYSQNFTNRYYHTNYTFNAIADGYVGLFGESRNFTGNTQLNFTMIVDIYPPTWSNPWDNSTDTSPRINENIRMNLTLNDDVDLFSYTFSWNGTGSWTNDSIQLISGTEHILSVIKQVGLPRDNTIGWRVYFNDTSENSNTSDIFTFTVKNTPPLLDSINANVSYVKSDDSIMISTDGASDADGDDLRLECGDAPELSNLCIGSYGGGERTCTFSSPWSDNTEHTIYCRVYDGINVSTPDRTTAVTSDNLPPQVSIVIPEETSYNITTFNLEYTYTELYCDVVWWGNLTHNSSTQDCGLNWTGLTASEGSNTWSVWMRDLAGNTNSSSVTFTVDTVELVLSVVSPLNDTFNASSSIVFNVTSDKELSWCGLSVDGASNVSMSLFGDGLGASYINASMADAEYEWRVWCNDTVGNWGSIDLYSFVVDTVPPLIDIISPQNITYNDPNILVNISVTELHIETILFTNSTGQNETYTTPDTRLWNEGPNTMIVYANDSAGNINTTTVTFTVDTVLPEIQLINPVNNSNINRSEVIFSVASTKELSWCGLSVNGADNITMDINGTGNGASYTNSTMPDNNYNFIVYCNDTVNNYGNTQLKHFLIDTIYPSVMFVDPTRNNGSYLKDDYVYVNVSSTDSNHHYTMLDWDNSLVGWWRFESNNGTHTFDDSGNDNHGNIIGATQTEAGMFGRGMEFDGDGNYVNTDSILIPSEDNWTLSTWINVPQNPMLVHGTIFSQHNSGMFYAYTTFGSADGHLRFNGVDGTTEILVGSDIRGTGWRHLVLLRDGSSFRLYLDGNLDSTGSSTGSVNTAQNFRLGHGEAGGLRWFDGIIDEVIIMNRALSLEEIQALYSATASQYEKNFSQLEDGTYSFRAYSVDKGGNKNQTESREIIVDTISPSVAFVPPTPDDQQELGVDYVYINVTSSDANDHYTFLDYDESLRGWWRFEETNGTHIFDESSTNLALNPGFADGTTNGWSDAGGLGGIITGGLYSSYSFNLTSGEGTAHILRNSLELSPGTYYMQVWYEHIEGHVPYFFTSGFEGSINIITDFITGPGIRKAEVILTVTANTQHPSIRYAAAAPADRTEGITIIHAIQIEEGNKGTGFSYQNHGILSGSTIGITEYGRFGRGIDLHAGTDHVVIPYSESLVNDVFGLTDVFTISAWSYPRAWENWATIINYANGSSWSNTLNGMWAYESGYRCVMGAGADGNPGGSVIGPNYNPGSSGLNQWYHVVCVADGTDIHIYVDGVHRGSSAISGLTHPRGEIIGPVTIGRRTPGSGPSFNGTIDDIIVFSRALTLDEVRALYDSTANQYRNNFTSQEGGEHTFRAYSVDIVGNKNETGLRTVTIDTVGPTWSDPWDNSTDNTPRINENIRMNLTLHDDADLASYRFSWNGTGSWTNDSIQYISGTEHTLSVVKTVGLPRNSTIGWRVYFNDSSGKSNVSDIFTFTIKNTPPQTPILEYPEDEDDLFINRTPTFNWTATDADDDELTFNIQVALDDGFSAIILDESGLSTNEYYQGIPLELDTQYYWRVMANDSYDTSDWSDSSTFTTVPYTSITLDNDNIDFGTLRINEQNDTEDNNPIPIIVRNTGNIEANISLNATSFWTTQPLDTPFYQYKARSFLTNSFDIGTSQMTYHNMSTTRLLAISRLEWHENNTGYIDLRVLAPAAEPPGPKSSTIYITGVAS